VLESRFKRVSMNRRKFLHATAAAAAGTAAGCGSSQRPFRFLAAREARTLEAICACLIPDDADPGANQAGVIHYIDRQLTRRFREHQPAYREGLAAADAIAGGSFADAPRGRQEEILIEMERRPDTRAFFGLVVTHAMQGFYGNPRHGGNRNFASWRMLGVSPVQVRGRDQYDFTKGSGNEKG
jgi:gluconate 2-dehydrogenase gamma chain